MLTYNGVQYLVEKDVARRYGLSVHWFRKARYIGGGPRYFKMGEKVFYTLEDVDEYFKNHLVATKGASYPK